jgi:hypothetical protein
MPVRGKYKEQRTAVCFLIISISNTEKFWY